MQSDLFQVLTRSQAIERGLDRYFTGIPCKNGHVSERLVDEWLCLACRAQRMARYRRTEKFKAAIRKFQQSAKFKDSIRRYRETEGYKAIAREYDRARAVKRNAGKRAYRQTEEGREATRRYNQSDKHRAALFLNNRARRARKRNAGGKFTAEDERKLRERQLKCHICSRRFSKADPATLDHVIPLAKGRVTRCQQHRPRS